MFQETELIPWILHHNECCLLFYNCSPAIQEHRQWLSGVIVTFYSWKWFVLVCVELQHNPPPWLSLNNWSCYRLKCSLHPTPPSEASGFPQHRQRFQTYHNAPCTNFIFGKSLTRSNNISKQILKYFGCLFESNSLHWVLCSPKYKKWCNNKNTISSLPQQNIFFTIVSLLNIIVLWAISK